MMTEAAPAKINLTLHVTGWRADGYHLLDSLVVFAGAHDRVTGALADTVSLALDGPFARGLEAEPDNLVLRAARALARACGTRKGASIRLEKHLPVASGIGGGSADAAAALRLLVRLWGLSPSPMELLEIALSLGADVPVCLHPRPRRMAGVGESLLPGPAMPPCGLVLVNPGVGLETRAVFGARSGGFSRPASLPRDWPNAVVMARDLAQLSNDLEAPARELCPQIGGVLAALAGTEGCLLARMSGSGATCFGLFASAAEAVRGADRLRRPGWWCWGGGLWQAGGPLYAGLART